ncbi:thiol reductant ABC exporter subunit CydC [Paenibacillaceae bacterium]|nr:thiol reductant ABC exporter subunit CydC [Paenibacillaceae bacterium]
MSKKSAQQLNWLVPYIKRYFWQFALAALLGALAIACAGALLFTSGYLISRSSLRPENILMVYVPIVLVRTFGFSKAVVQYLERLLGHDASLRVLAKMRSRLYHALEPQALRLGSQYSTGDLLGLLADDIERLQNVFLKTVLPALAGMLVYAAAMIALGWFDVQFAILMACYCGFLLFGAPAIALWSSLAKRQQLKRERGALYRELTDAVFGMSDWLLSGRKQQFLSNWQQRQQTAAELDHSLRKRDWRRQWLSQCAVGVGVVFMIWWAGGQAGQQNMAFVWIAAFTLIAFPLLEAFARMSDAVVNLPDYQTSLTRLAAVEAAEPARSADGEEAGNGKASTIAAATTGDGQSRKSAAGTVTASVSKSPHLKIDTISFHHGSEAESAADWSIRDVMLDVPYGRTVALLGRSGSGKSTLLNLILGELVPHKGEITVNGTAVQRLTDNRSEVFAVLNQQPYLFDTTVANNIRLGRPDASDQEIHKAAELAGIGELIASLPKGYDTRMEETGRRFSGGERQRIALARILLQDAPIVLLDEPTVGLDPITERDLMNTIFQVLRGKTLIWVTHHLVGMEKLDAVMFMEQGKITMQGTHEQLLRDVPQYQRLYALDCPPLSS